MCKNLICYFYISFITNLFVPVFRSLAMLVGVPNYKVILCGEYGVGKSSIFRRFLNNTFFGDDFAKRSIGLDQCTRRFYVNKSEIKVIGCKSTSIHP